MRFSDFGSYREPIGFPSAYDADGAAGGDLPLAAEPLPRGVIDEITGLTTFKNCRLITTEWSDGVPLGDLKTLKEQNICHFQLICSKNF